MSNGWFDWAYKGVDHSFPGNGGLECRDFLSLSQRCWESGIASLVAFVVLIYAFPRLRLPCDPPCGYSSIKEPVGKRVLLLLMCLTFGIELGFKLATRQMIWIGNPCHLATMMQIFILAAPPSRIVTAAFRLHLHMLTGAPIAILFPVINTRLLPFETSVYFVQHILMLIIPLYLMKTGDPYIPEKLFDFNWALTSFGFLFIYHFLPLQMLAYASQVNLNNMLCPAVSDPFHGKYYRLFAIAHQLILIPTQGKIFMLMAKAFKILPEGDWQREAPISQVFHGRSSQVFNVRSLSAAGGGCCSPPCSPPCSPRCTPRCMPRCVPRCSPRCSSTDSCYNFSNHSDHDSGLGNSNNPPECQQQEACSPGTATGTSRQYDDIFPTAARGSSLFRASRQAEDGGEEQDNIESSGESQEGSSRDYNQAATFVTRRLVNGTVMPQEECDDGPAIPEKRSYDRTFQSSRDQSRSGILRRDPDRPMTMSDLTTGSNGHAKSH